MRSITWWHCRSPRVTANRLKLPPIFTFCTAIHSFVMAARRNFKFGKSHCKSQPGDEKYFLKGRGNRQVTVLEFYTLWNISATANARDFKFCTRVGHVKSCHEWQSECSLSGRCQGYVSNFYIVNLENFATASRRYTGDIHKSSMIGLFMTPIGQWKRLDRVTVECTCLLRDIWNSDFVIEI